MDDEFLDEHLFMIQQVAPWYADIINYLVTQELPADFLRVRKKKIKKEVRHYVWDDLYLWKYYADQIIRRCFLETELASVLIFCHSHASGGTSVLSG